MPRTTLPLQANWLFIQKENYKTLYEKFSLLTKLIKCALNSALKLTFSLFLFFFAFWLHFRPPKHCLIPLSERQFFIQTTVERRKEKVHFIGDLGPSKWEFWHYLSGHLFLAELSACRKCRGIYCHRERSRSREICQPSLLFSLLSSAWVKTVAQKEVLNSA